MWTINQIIKSIEISIHHKTSIKEMKTQLKRYSVLTDQKSIVKISIPAKAVNRFKGIPVKIPTAFFTGIE